MEVSELVEEIEDFLRGNFRTVQWRAIVQPNAGARVMLVASRENPDGTLRACAVEINLVEAFTPAGSYNAQRWQQWGMEAVSKVVNPLEPEEGTNRSFAS